LLTFATEMRTTIFFIFLCSLFLVNRTHAVINKARFYSVSHSSSHNQSLDRSYVLGSSIDSNRIIEDTDEDNTHIDKSNKICSLTNDLVNQWQLEFLGLTFSKNDFKGNKYFKPLDAYSQPIYILQRVLRI